MPGLSQLKQFNKDIQSLGDELTVRAARGEKPVLVPIPKSVKDVNDTEDFVLGMPEKPAVETSSSVDEDLSDITGFATNSKSAGGKSESEEETQSFAAPDMSSLLAPDLSAFEDSSDSGMPDLSMFMDNPEPEVTEEVVEEEPEIAVADMGLEALLGGMGFDGSEGAVQEESEVPVEEDVVSDFEEIEDLSEEEPAPLPEDNSEKNKYNGFGGEPLDLDILSETPESTPKADTGDALDISLFEAAPEPVESAQSFDDVPDLVDELDTLEDVPEMDFGNDSASDTLEDLDSLEEIPDLEAEDFDSPATPQSNLTDPFAEPVADFETPDFDDASLEEVPLDDFTGDFSSDSGSDSFDAPSADFDSSDSDFNTPSADFDTASSDFDSSVSDFDTASADFDTAASDFDTASSDFNTDLPDFGTESSDDFGLPDMDQSMDFGNLDGSGDFSDIDMFGDGSASPKQKEESVSDDFSADSFGSDDFGTTDFESEDTKADDDFSAITDFEPFEENADDSNGMEDVTGDFTDDGPIEVFETTGMEDIDFGIQDTDSQMNAEGPSLDDDFDSSDFEIPGFSDVTTAKEQTGKSKKAKNLDEPDFSGALPGNELPPNTLSDEQYKTFLKNLSNYPLNVRLAFEDLIVQDEFTDDAEFEIIEKILNKAPARQVAAALEKMLDISIPVPRDFEHRTAEEYEAYKKSIGYQLRNKILPGLILFVVLLFVGWGLFNFTKNCIYIPAKASKYYKQGYALLEADEYPQAQLNFDKAAGLKLKKKWFFKYARGYRDHKQYQRAEDIYQKTLIYFNHDKEAGLEYAGMELYDLANYERAEEIIRRQILDYHVNDADGILLLGDTYLEWGTEKNPAKLEDAKQEYLRLMQLYKPNNTYNSRMMLYYIRSDNLAQVIGYQKMFDGMKKNPLSADECTELSGYLLKKMYGPLSPAEENLRYQIEGLRKLLLKAVSLNPENPVALYNLGNYYVQTNEIGYVESTLKNALNKFNTAKKIKTRDIYKYIDSYRLLGENYIKTNDYLQAQEQYTNGIALYTTEKERGGFEGNSDIGLLYEDLANINYTIAGDYESAAKNYKNSVELGNDKPEIRYRLGYISYKNKNYLEALGSFMKAGEGNIKEPNLMMAMGNTFYMRNDYHAAEGNYEQLLDSLDKRIADKGGAIYPQSSDSEGHDIVTKYLYAANNYGVTLYRLAKRTGDSSKNAQAIVQLQNSIRAWDALTRNQQSMVRLEGSNLAQENIKYIAHPFAEFDPSIYIDIAKTLTDSEKL